MMVTLGHSVLVKYKHIDMFQKKKKKTICKH
jgi:hypothetical protein